jgi:hypothetical protein
MNDEASEARKIAGPTTSSTRPRRRIGVRATASASISGACS